MGIVVYSILGCPHCQAAKARLQDSSLQYTEVSLDRFPAHVREWVRATTGKTSVPQIFFHSKYVGGNVELQALLDDEARRKEALAELAEGPREGEELPLMPHPSELLEEEGEEEEEVCERDELALLAGKLEKSGLLQTHRLGCWGSAPDSISGASLHSFLQSEGQEEGQGQALLDGLLLVGVRGERRVVADCLYTLVHLQPARGLNMGQLAECRPREADMMARVIRKIVLGLFADFLSSDGRRVDYSGMAASDKWASFTKMATQLQRVDIEHISDDHKLAFVINIYNVLVIHGTVEKGVPASTYQRYKFFSSTSYNLGGHLLSLNDLENGILRSNRSSMATLYRTPFSPSDRRLKLALPVADPRIHFALNCGAKSCPPIKTFSGDEVQEQLEVATQAFLESDDALLVDTTNKQIQLSMLFKWYSVDFAPTTEALLAWILEHLTEPVKKAQLKEVLNGGDFKVSYITYDWGHNAKE